MLDKIGHIKNPLTVIAMFAAIAEVSGAIVLPFIAAENQATYIWFLMIFPGLLVLVFFLTLNFNHKVLYAPSDWKDEANFFRMFTKASVEERKEKLRDEFSASQLGEEPTPESARPSPPRREEEPEAPREGPITAPEPPSPTDGQRVIRTSLRNDPSLRRYREIEKAAIAKLSSLLSLQFQQDIAYQTASSRRIIYDAVALEANKVTAAEVRLVFNQLFSPHHLDRLLLETERVAESVRSQNKEFTLHVVAVADRAGLDLERIRTNFHRVASKFDYNIKVHVFTAQELGFPSSDADGS